MTSRERWTVYPLLFLSLGMGLRSRLPGMQDANSVQCENLTISGSDGKPVVRLGSTTSNQGFIEFISEGKPLLIAGGSQNGKSGQLFIQNSKGKPQVGMYSTDQSGIVQICGPDGSPQLLMRSTKRGGNMAAWRADHSMVMMVGHDDQESGVFIFDPATGRRAAGVPFATITRPPPPLTPPAKAEPPKPEQPDPAKAEKQKQE